MMKITKFVRVLVCTTYLVAAEELPSDGLILDLDAAKGLTFGRFDVNKPQALGPVLEPNKFHLIAGRMGAGQGIVKLELFINSATAVSAIDFPVNPKFNPSRMAIGQERDAIQHPGQESFDGEIARFLIWDKPLDNDALKKF